MGFIWNVLSPSIQNISLVQKEYLRSVNSETLLLVRIFSNDLISGMSLNRIRQDPARDELTWELQVLTHFPQRIVSDAAVVAEIRGLDLPDDERVPTSSCLKASPLRCVQSKSVTIPQHLEQQSCSNLKSEKRYLHKHNTQLSGKASSGSCSWPLVYQENLEFGKFEKPHPRTINANSIKTNCFTRLAYPILCRSVPVCQTCLS